VFKLDDGQAAGLPGGRSTKQTLALSR